MFNYKHYVAVLKAKEGEFNALEETSPATKNNMTPLLEVTDIPWNYESDSYSKSIDEHLRKLGEKINLSWGNEKPIFIDSDQLDGNARMLDGTTHHLIWLFDQFRSLNLQTIPVTSFHKHADYKDAVRSIQATDQRGICLRLYKDDLINAHLSANLINELQYYDISANEMDLVIDLKTVEEDSLAYISYTISNVINNVLPFINDWRTLTICGSAFPINLSDIQANTVDTVNRWDWLLWKNILAGGLKRKPSFGDYNISHWDTLDLDPRIMTMSANIRYTCDDYWLIIRGRAIKLQSGQHHNLCTVLLGRSEYCGRHYSWGDQYINDCAARTVGPGNPTTWRKVGCNHHFQKVTDQIAIVP